MNHIFEIFREHYVLILLGGSLLCFIAVVVRKRHSKREIDNELGVIQARNFEVLYDSKVNLESNTFVERQKHLKKLSFLERLIIKLIPIASAGRNELGQLKPNSSAEIMLFLKSSDSIHVYNTDDLCKRCMLNPSIKFICLEDEVISIEKGQNYNLIQLRSASTHRFFVRSSIIESAVLTKALKRKRIFIAGRIDEQKKFSNGRGEIYIEPFGIANF